MSVATSYVGLRMPDEMKEELERRARENFRSLSGEIKFLINQGLAVSSPDQASDPQPAGTAAREKE